MIEIKEYIDINGHNRFERWFNRLNTVAALKVRKYLARLENANFYGLRVWAVVFLNVK